MIYTLKPATDDSRNVPEMKKKCKMQETHEIKKGAHEIM